MYDYQKPFYMPGYTTTLPFQAEFKDNITTFVSFKYRISKGLFKSRLGAPLKKIYDYRGVPIINRFKIASDADMRDYKVLTETLTPSTFYDEVVETYGHIPINHTYYVKYSTASVFFIGSAMRDKLWGQTQYTEDGSYDYGFEIQDESWVAVPPNTQPIFSGDKFDMRRPYSNPPTMYRVRSDEFVAQETNKLPIPVFRNVDQGTEYYGSEIAPEEIFNDQKANDFRRLVLVLKERLSPARNDTVVVETRTQFFDSKPQIIPRTKWVNAGGAEVEIEQDGSGFAPEAGLYDGKYCIEDSAISQDLSTGLWRRDVKLTEWKVF